MNAILICACSVVISSLFVWCAMRGYVRSLVGDVQRVANKMKTMYGVLVKEREHLEKAVDDFTEYASSIMKEIAKTNKKLCKDRDNLEKMGIEIKLRADSIDKQFAESRADFRRDRANFEQKQREHVEYIESIVKQVQATNTTLVKDRADFEKTKDCNK